MQYFDTFYYLNGIFPYNLLTVFFGFLIAINQILFQEKKYLRKDWTNYLEVIARTSAHTIFSSTKSFSRRKKKYQKML